MATGKAPDPKRRKTPHTHASYLKVPNGGKEPCYKAGDLYGCYGHRTHAHQPCVYDITEGELKCPYCASGLVPEWRGYVPLWDRDWCLRYVLIAEDYFASVEAIPIGNQVAVIRAKNPISPIVIREESVLTRSLPDKAPWNSPVNMLNVCLTLWKDDALTRLVRLQTEGRAERETMQRTVKRGSTTAADPLARLRDAEAKARAEDQATETKIGNVIDQVLKPSTNGHAPFKKPR